MAELLITWQAAGAACLNRIPRSLGISSSSADCVASENEMSWQRIGSYAPHPFTYVAQALFLSCPSILSLTLTSLGSFEAENKPIFECPRAVCLSSFRAHLACTRDCLCAVPSRWTAEVQRLVGPADCRDKSEASEFLRARRAEDHLRCLLRYKRGRMGGMDGYGSCLDHSERRGLRKHCYSYSGLYTYDACVQDPPPQRKAHPLCWTYRDRQDCQHL